MTEKKRVESEMIRIDRLVSMGILTEGVANQFGNPLGAVSGRVEMVLDRLDDPSQKEHLRITLGQINRIKKMPNERGENCIGVYWKAS